MGGVAQNRWLIMEHTITMNDWRVTLFQDISGHLQDSNSMFHSGLGSSHPILRQKLSPRHPTHLTSPWRLLAVRIVLAPGGDLRH